MNYDPSLDYLDDHQMAVIRMAHDLSDRHMMATGAAPSILRLSTEAWYSSACPMVVIGMKVVPDMDLRGFSAAVFARR